MVAVRKRAPARMTLDEFLGWDPGDAAGHRWQLLDGEPVAMPPAGEPHGAIQGEIIGLLGNHLDPFPFRLTIACMTEVGRAFGWREQRQSLADACRQPAQ